MAEEQKQKVYPSTRYHKKTIDVSADIPYDAVIVKDEEEDRKLGPGWYDTPAAFAEEDDAKAKKKNHDDDDKSDKKEHSEPGRFRPRT